MQKLIFGQKNKIAICSGILIICAFFAKLVFHNDGFAFYLLAVASLLGVMPIAMQAYQALRIKIISIDVLVTIAVIGAFAIKNVEESAIVSFLFLFGAYLEQKTLIKTRKALKELTDMAPLRALKLVDNGEFIDVAIDQVQVNDILLVRTGSMIPVDGIVASGEGYVNEASITGESNVVEKSKGSEVFAGTIVEDGTIQIIANRVGEDTTFAKIIELVEEAQDAKSKVERFIDRFSKYYTPAILIFSVFIFVLIRDIELAIMILVLGCPGALVIGVPVSNVAGIGNGARHGILLKGSEVIHAFSKVDTIVFDKTGTLTMGKPKVTEVKTYGNIERVIEYLASVEMESEHPLAKAIVNHIGQIQTYLVEKTEITKGYGIKASINSHIIVVGNKSFMEQQNIMLEENVLRDITDLEKQGNSLVLVSLDNEIRLLMGIRDQVRPDVKKELLKLKELGVEQFVILSGDNQSSVDAVASNLGFTQALGHMLPEDKAMYVQKLQKQGRIVAFVGDGVNDSPSIALADIGIALGSGTDVAIETSDVVLVRSDLSSLTYSLALAKATVKTMRQNILLAVGVVFVLLFSVFFSEWMNMSIGMLVHEASILIVIVNAMRLLRYQYHS